MILFTKKKKKSTRTVRWPARPRAPPNDVPAGQRAPVTQRSSGAAIFRSFSCESLLWLRANVQPAAAFFPGHHPLNHLSRCKLPAKSSGPSPLFSNNNRAGTTTQQQLRAGRGPTPVLRVEDSAVSMSALIVVNDLHHAPVMPHTRTVRSVSEKSRMGSSCNVLTQKQAQQQTG